MEDLGRESDHLMLITPERVFYAGLLGRPRKRTPGCCHVYVAVKGKPMRLLVQAVGERVRSQFDRPWGDTPRMSQLVVIAERHHIDRAAIEATLGV